METLVIFGKEYRMFRPIGGANSNKFNRSAKLMYNFESLSKKMDGFIKRGLGVTDTARMALAVKMMMYTGIRIGNEGSAEGYMTKPHPNSKKQPEFVKTYGLTTLLPEHVIIAPRRVLVNFIGKKQVDNSFILTGYLAKQFKQTYKYSENTVFDLSAYELTKFIKRYVGKQYSPKDFRTMRANMYANNIMDEIMNREEPATKKQFNAEVKEITTFVSEQLNNTPGVCKASYIDPKVWEYFTEEREIIN